ncbi:MAG: hypothetical protein V3S21_07830, partial [Xanthomonadales bacterium]
MMERIKQRVSKTSILLVLMFAGGNVIAQPVQENTHPAMDPDKARVVEHWTQERLENAIPRELVIDSRGLAYLRMPNGFLEPYGHGIAAQANAADRKPLAKPSGGDTNPPTIDNMDPDGISIGSSYTFSADVTDLSGVKSVSFTIRYPNNSTTQTFSASKGTGDSWKVSLQGFSEGLWSWKVVAKDKASKGGNTSSTDWVAFTVDTGSGDGGGDGGGGGTGTDTITNAE